jgi:hypothetical protein
MKMATAARITSLRFRAIIVRAAPVPASCVCWSRCRSFRVREAHLRELGPADVARTPCTMQSFVVGYLELKCIIFNTIYAMLTICHILAKTKSDILQLSKDWFQSKPAQSTPLNSHANAEFREHHATRISDVPASASSRVGASPL